MKKETLNIVHDLEKDGIDLFEALIFMQKTCAQMKMGLIETELDMLIEFFHVLLCNKHKEERRTLSAVLIKKRLDMLKVLVGNNHVK